MEELFIKTGKLVVTTLFLCFLLRCFLAFDTPATERDKKPGKGLPTSETADCRLAEGEVGTDLNIAMSC